MCEDVRSGADLKLAGILRRWPVISDVYDVGDTLDLLVQAATSFTSAVEAGSLLRDPEGNLPVLASTTERASDVEEGPLGADEGSCLAGIESGEPVEVPDIASHGR